MIPYSYATPAIHRVLYTHGAPRTHPREGRAARGTAIPAPHTPQGAHGTIRHELAKHGIGAIH